MASLFNTLRQERHEARAEALKILETPAANRTPEQAARLDAIEARVAVLDPEIDRVAKFMETERNAGTAEFDTLEVGKDRASERPWGPNVPSGATERTIRQAFVAGLGEFGVAIVRAAQGKGFDPRLMAAASGMGEAVDSEGGFAVPVEYSNVLERDMFAGGELLSRVDARDITGNSISYLVVDESSRATTRSGGVLGYWVDEGTAATNTHPTLARVEFKLRKVAALGYLTDELVSDAAALGGELAAMFVEELIFQVEDAITEGSGVNKPLGYLNAPCLVSISKETGQSAATINNWNLSKMWARMASRDKANSVWLANGDCGPQLDMLSIPAGASALEPRFVNYSPAGILTIKGRPVIETEYNATLGTVGDLVLINPRRYRLTRKGGVQQAQSMHVRFVQGEQTLRATYRCDGQMMPRAAITPFKGGSTKTLSPVVAIETRS